MRLLESDVEFADNPEPRCACLLLLDTSGSMRGRKIDELNKGVAAFKQALASDPLASKRVEVAVVSFDSQVSVVQEFISADDFRAPLLQAEGKTAMGAGIHCALDLIQSRKAKYRQNGIVYYRPWLFLVSDGISTDDTGSAAARVREASSRKEVAFFAIGVSGADMPFLERLAVDQAPAQLRGLDFTAMFVWLSQSLAKVAQSSASQSVMLPPPTWTV